MKEFKLFILTPTTGFVRSGYAFSLANLVMHYAQNRIFEDNPSQSLNVHSIEGSGISANRESLAKDALRSGCSHILFIDEDMGFAPHTLEILARRNLPVVGANYKMRVAGKDFTALAPDKETRIVTTKESTGVERCHYTGFGFCLIERSVFEQIDKPWFLIGYNTIAQSYTTEDAGFARRLCEKDIPWYVDHDASKCVSHVGNYIYTWKQMDYAGEE